jgi:hypothetical protein
MTAVQDKIWDALAELSGEDVLRYFTNYHGTQLLDDGFAEHLIDEGVLEEEPEEEDEEDPNMDMDEEDEDD